MGKLGPNFEKKYSGPLPLICSRWLLEPELPDLVPSCVMIFSDIDAMLENIYWSKEECKIHDWQGVWIHGWHGGTTLSIHGTEQWNPVRQSVGGIW